MTLDEAFSKYPDEILVKRNDSACAFKLGWLMRLKIITKELKNPNDKNLIKNLSADDWEVCSES